MTRICERAGLVASLLVFILVGLVGCQEVQFSSLPSSFDLPTSSLDSPVLVGALDPPYTLAILPLENVNPNSNLQWLGKHLAVMLASDLAKWPTLSVIAREALGSVLREQWLQHRQFSLAECSSQSWKHTRSTLFSAWEFISPGSKPDYRYADY